MEITKNQTFRISHVHWPKRYFDVNSKEDIKEYKFFLDNNRWRDNCPFTLEDPYLSIPDMIRIKLVDKYIEGMIKSAK